MLSFRLLRQEKGNDVSTIVFWLVLSRVPVVSTSGVFTPRSLRSRGDKSKNTVEDDSNGPILVNTCLVLVNRFCTIEYGRTTRVLEFLGCGTL